MKTDKDAIQLTEAYELVVKEGIERKTITDRLRDNAAKNDREKMGKGEQESPIGPHEYGQAERWINQINADVMIGLRTDPQHVIKNINKLIQQLQSLVVSVEKFNNTKRQ